MRFTQEGMLLQARLRSPIDTEKALRDAERWWRTLPADIRDAATAWAESANQQH
jgi:hypothetical protein